MTIEEALNTIPDPEIRARALMNRENSDKERYHERDVSCLESGIMSAFGWLETKEGDRFWANVQVGNITTWQQACAKYPHLRELPMLSEEKVVTENVEVIQLPLPFFKWYSGMDEEKIMKAYERWKRETVLKPNKSDHP